LNDFETRRPYPAGGAIAARPVRFGAENSVALGVRDDLWLTLPRGDFERLEARTVLPDTLHAPLARHATVGRLQLLLDGNLQHEMPLITLNAIAAGNLAQRVADRLRLWWRANNDVQAAP
jgi:D-alanyl-D-alanine carboxypeptidase (penicillin-binding protein 5/6)